jgi:hypothetical protein
MLKKAREEGSVTHVTTLWDSFFEGGRDHRYDKPSVTHIPYLEGDYWPGEAENLLSQIQDGQRSAVTGACVCLTLLLLLGCGRRGWLPASACVLDA